VEPEDSKITLEDDEILQKPENALRFHRQAQQGVFRKMERVYGMTKEDAVLPARLSASLDEAVKETLKIDIWQQRRDNWRKTETASPTPSWWQLRKKRSGLKTSPTQKTLDVTAREIMTDYANSMYLRSRLDALYWTKLKPKLRKHEQLTAEEDHTQCYDHDDLLDIYINHITNEAQTKLTMLTGGDVNAAFSMHTFLIGKTIGWAAGHFDLTDHKTIKPPGDRSKSPAENVADLKEYWINKAGTASWRYHCEKEDHPHPGHVARLEAQAREEAEKGVEL
jgi:hypothetical protein